ncbi:MAG: NAD-dependent epimerase/dehydratase [Candidatus Gottesmanbacteria bacterium GW2011_GWA2_42_18]|uniref:NAD-dependent epimerase/dehydratase n=1 Tax=Candidatus Gottesmanbacteria bacterium GW2011_GWA2_42_18 TaxID=1618442 RepID=A0A0G1BJG3_9BACT|nr:MAG: NAD-dependent epimerase/dehydratase [Candidatus Gottesmanbacteria bacterium GW2011_GWA2_42_18]
MAGEDLSFLDGLNDFVQEGITSIVSGGAGFIGSHLCDRLIDKKHRVICIDNLLTGNLNNIRHLLENPAFKFIKADLVSDEIKGLGNRADYVYHLASPASPPKYRKYSIETLLVNSQGTYKMLEISRQYKSNFLLASTSEVYGDPKEHPQKETYYGYVNPTGVRACYDEGKRFAEALTMEYYRKYKTKIRIIRIFNTYGPRMQISDGRVVSNFITQALSGKAVTIYGKGNQTAELIVSKTASRSKIIHQDKRLDDDPELRRPDITRARKLINWHPKVSLGRGLDETIAYFKR